MQFYGDQIAFDRCCKQLKIFESEPKFDFDFHKFEYSAEIKITLTTGIDKVVYSYSHLTSRNHKNGKIENETFFMVVMMKNRNVFTFSWLEIVAILISMDLLHHHCLVDVN